MNLKHIVIAIPLLFATQAHAHNGEVHSTKRIKLTALSTYKSGPYDKGAAEIVSFDPETQRAFVTNGHTIAIDAISLAKLSSPVLDFSIDMKPYGAPNSVAVKNGLVAVAVQAKPKQKPGSIVVFDLNGKHLNTFQAGALPDMVTFTPDGKYILAANEGEPNDDYTVDPEGSITLIEVGTDIAKQTQKSVRTADFKVFNDAKLDPRIRIFGKNASVAQDLEPEYIAVSADSKTAWVSLQENNALAEIDIERGLVKELFALGTQSHNNAKTAIDASDKDKKINIQAWPVEGMYQPDSIAAYEVEGRTYIVTANEGDARDYKGYSEETRVGKMDLDKELLTANPKLAKSKNLGRLKVSKVGADSDGNGKVDKFYSYGTRSFSIWDENGFRVYDSGSQFARITARDYPRLFNRNDARSDNKGSEPEALALGKIGDATFAFIGLERTGGVMVYNITDPQNAFYVDYLNTLSAELEPDDPKQGDIAPEGIVFVNAVDSPSGKPFIITANEISGTTSVYQINEADPKNH